MNYVNGWQRSAATGDSRARADGRRFRWVIDAIWPLTLTITAAIAVMLPTTLPTEARLSLFVFAFAVTLWSTTSINAAYVALMSTLLLVLTGGTSQERLFEALASEVIWLMIGAFVLGGAIQQTGLAGRLTDLVLSRARTVGHMFWMLTTALILLSFFIPSTSGRAAVALPIFHSIADLAEDRRITRALALLIPTVILVATISTLIGAGSHLIANDLLRQLTGRQISFAQWALYGMPFGVVAGYVSCRVIMRLFLDRGCIKRRLPRIHSKRQKLSGAEWMTLTVALLMVALWLLESWHGLEIATISVAGAMMLTLPGVGVMKWKDGMKAISWNLIIFVGAALVLGEALIESGAAQWLVDGIFALSGLAGAESNVLVLLLLSFITLTSHIYMTSHTARAAALVPALLLLANSLKLNPVAVMFIGTVGMNYCLTFPVSSKALLMFQELDVETYQPSDLLRLSSVLLLVHIGLIGFFYYAYWQWIGLAL